MVSILEINVSCFSGYYIVLLIAGELRVLVIPSSGAGQMQLTLQLHFVHFQQVELILQLLKNNAIKNNVNAKEIAG
jgi:hypothetical protein